ncbi:hypothetical protein [Streptomyces sp. RKCA744]|uniref:hypothetical protein n=1 Tax=Streptomyces sp. RKCA744 TaxID=2959340 RepID=UPI00209D58D4|nr:hypothetical protein [Streptomyces sp. RKCA744]MCO8307128.1 hypothetical protein [Streptomyces sp. RKCA744]
MDEQAIAKMTRITGSHQAQWLDALHRHHAVVEDRVRTNKAMGLHNLPAKSYRANQCWMLAANLAADLDAWLRLLALHDQDDLNDAEFRCSRSDTRLPAPRHTMGTLRANHLVNQRAAHADESRLKWRSS